MIAVRALASGGSCGGLIIFCNHKLGAGCQMELNSGRDQGEGGVDVPTKSKDAWLIIGISPTR